MKQFINPNKIWLTASFCIMTGIFFAIVYLLGANACAENNPAPKEVANKTDNKQALAGGTADKTASVPFDAEFAKITGKCVKCHTVKFSSMDTLKEGKWIVPGKPENSLMYRIIGKNKKPDGNYHNLTKTEKAMVYNYIKNLK